MFLFLIFCPYIVFSNTFSRGYLPTIAVLSTYGAQAVSNSPENQETVKKLIFEEDESDTFQHSVTCVPTVGKFKLINTSPDEELEVLSVESSDPKQFHPTIIQPVSLRPSDHLQVTIVFLPLEPGPLHTQLKVVTSTGDLYYDLDGHASLNKWGLTDIGATGLYVDEIVSFPIELHNPTEKLIYFEDIFPVESDNTDWATVELREDDISDIFVGPGMTETIAKLKVQVRSTMMTTTRRRMGEPSRGNVCVALVVSSLSAILIPPSLPFQIVEPGDHAGYVHIRTKGEGIPKFVVPLSFSVLQPGLFLPPIIDFGILTSPDTVATLPVKIKNVGREYLAVTGYYSTASALSITPADDAVIPPKEESTVWLSYSGEEEGEMEGVLRVMSNSSDPRWMEVEIKVKGKIMWGGVGWKESDTWIKVNTEEMWKAKKVMGGQLEGDDQSSLEEETSWLQKKASHGSKHMIQFANFFKENVMMNNVSTDCGSVIQANVLSLSSEVVGFGESWPPIEFTYNNKAEGMKGGGGGVEGEGDNVKSGDPLFSCWMR